MDGLFEKFTVTRNEGMPKFRGEHFVLFPKRDPHAIAGMRAYAESCRDVLPNLAAHIDLWIAEIEREAR